MRASVSEENIEVRSQRQHTPTERAADIIQREFLFSRCDAAAPISDTRSVVFDQQLWN